MDSATELQTDLTPDSGMLLPRDALRFDFGGARFRLPQDAKLLGWIFDQFLYGEVTGIQCGHWLYRAPTLEAAAFFARQAVEELSHVRQFLRLYPLLGVRPGPAHRAVRFLATTSMGKSYAEHVATEMAVGEGLVLMVFYALIDTIEDAQIVKILSSAARQEERHVAFGERQTLQLLKEHPPWADDLLGLNLVSLWGIRRLASFVHKKLGRDHEVLRQAPAFLEWMVQVLELRLQKMGILQRPLRDISPGKKAWLISRAYSKHWLLGLKPHPKLLTETYLKDPQIREQP